MNKKALATSLIAIFAVSIVISITFVGPALTGGGINPGVIFFFKPPTKVPPPQKWALIVASDSSFPDTQTPEEWQDTGHFSSSAGQFSFISLSGSIGFWDSSHGCSLPGHSGPGSVNVTNPLGLGSTGIWTTYQFFAPGSGGIPIPITDPRDYINLTACINTTNASGTQTGWWNTIPSGPLPIPPPGGGAYIGIIWLNGTSALNSIAIGATWSINFLTGTQPWTIDSINTMPMIHAPPGTQAYAIALVMDDDGDAYFDDVRLNITPYVKLGGKPNYDGFPSQALQAYNAVRSHGFDDAHIMMMIDSGDHIVNINATDAILNDYTYYQSKYPGCYDYEDASVTKANFITEMNASISGSWANKIGVNDSALIYMINHGTRINSTDAVFWFPRSGDNITEMEMQTLLNTINCSKLALFVDSCFSGNFIDSLDASNRIQVSASGDIPAWYWKIATPFHWAGSWFFHQFWEDLNRSLTIQQAYTNGSNYIPWGQSNNVNTIQNPQIRDSSGLLNTWNPLL
ncbi:MAG: C13 family peptidase [Promethearchaeota archaeon]